jgi:hypothetical protein
MGVVVVVRAPGAIVRRLEVRGLRVLRRGLVRTLELSVVNRGNVTESFTRSRLLLSLERGARRLALLRGDPRELRPRTHGVLQFRYRGPLAGPVVARIDVSSDAGRVIRRSYRVRL